MMVVMVAVLLLVCIRQSGKDELTGDVVHDGGGACFV
jgi:hypothetical protein